MFEAQLRRTPAARPSGNVHLFDIARRETVKVNIYLPDGSNELWPLLAKSEVASRIWDRLVELRDPVEMQPRR